MTTDQNDAGRLDRLDRLIAEKVMRWKWGRLPNPEPEDDFDGWLAPRPDNPSRVRIEADSHWSPTRDANAMMEVVEKMKDRDPVLRYDGRRCLCIMDASSDPTDTKTTWHDHRTYTTARRRVDAHAETMMLAVAECALRALGVDVEGAGIGGGE